MKQPPPRRINSRPAPEQVGKLSDLGFVLRQTSLPKLLFGGACLLSLVEIAASLTFPVLTKAVVDRLGTDGLTGSAMLADTGLGLLCAVLVAAAFAGATSRYLLSKVGLGVVAALKTRLVEKLIAAPVAYLENSASGVHTSRVMQDTRILSQLVSRDALNAFSGLLLLGGTAVILFTLDVALASILFGVIGVAFLISLPIIATLAGTAFRLQEVTAALSGRLTQLFSEIRLVKASGGESAELARGRDDINALFTLGLRTARVESALQPIISLAVTCSMITILAYGGIRVAEGSLTAGTLTAFLLYIFAVVGPLAQLSSFFSQLSSARGASLRIAEVLQCPTEQNLAKAALSAARAEPDTRKPLIFKDVTFTYPGSREYALSIGHLQFDVGSKTAIIGPSGCGKSTLLSLIERFHAPNEGSICYGDCNIADFDLVAWRARLGYVSQSAAMLSGSIRENLLYGLSRPVAQDEIETALKLSRCDEFVRRLEQGIETQIGEHGILLSGGQRQRIALGQMFLRNPDILLLDEATSQLDEENEHLIVQGLRALMQDRTTIFVTHRLALVEHMDRIIMLDSGQISGSGDHIALLESNQAYRRVATRAYVPEIAA